MSVRTSIPASGRPFEADEPSLNGDIVFDQPQFDLALGPGEAGPGRSESLCRGDDMDRAKPSGQPEFIRMPG